MNSALPTVANGDEAKTVFIDLPRPKSTWKAVGIERLREWAHSGSRDPNQLMVYAGVSVTGEDISFDLASAPHLLVGGTTGSGKSICLHSLLLSLLLRHTPETLQLALIDPKQVEFQPYAKLPNLYRGEVGTEIPVAREMLTELAAEMDAGLEGGRDGELDGGREAGRAASPPGRGASAIMQKRRLTLLRHHRARLRPARGRARRAP